MALERQDVVADREAAVGTRTAVDANTSARSRQPHHLVFVARQQPNRSRYGSIHSAGDSTCVSCTTDRPTRVRRARLAAEHVRDQLMPEADADQRVPRASSSCCTNAARRWIHGWSS
jgi:hypothetical protein